MHHAELSTYDDAGVVVGADNNDCVAAVAVGAWTDEIIRIRKNWTWVVEPCLNHCCLQTCSGCFVWSSHCSGYFQTSCVPGQYRDVPNGHRGVEPSAGYVAVAAADGGVGVDMNDANRKAVRIRGCISLAGHCYYSVKACVEVVE